MLSTNPTAPKDDKDQPINHIYQWLKHGSKATMFLNEHWSTPKQGFLFQDATTQEWYFVKGRKLSGPKLHLPEFANSMICNRKLFHQWRPISHVLNGRLYRSLSNVAAHHIVCCHVSATKLVNKSAPTSILQQQKMHPSDRKTWDALYREEFNGLIDCETYKIISEQEYL
mmetsp:Transcript_11376/g.16062  ORF Transcript_11376/g.16062 Transcript_11376/m.16062 type:complete len:170 (+) Transcript_11376:451-960(+)